MEELKNLPIDLCLLSRDEFKKRDLFVACVKNLMFCVRKEIEDIENKY